MVAHFDEMAKKLEFYAKTISHVLDTSVFITICWKKTFAVYVWHYAYFLYSCMMKNGDIECVKFSPKIFIRDLASILITSGWVFVPMLSAFLTMLGTTCNVTDKHYRTEKNTEL